MNFDGATVLCRAPNLAQRLFEGELLVITARDGMLHRFNEVGTFVWELLAKAVTVDAIVAAVAHAFGGFDPEKNRGDIERFIEELLHKKMVVAAPETVSG